MFLIALGRCGCDFVVYFLHTLTISLVILFTTTALHPSIPLDIPLHSSHRRYVHLPPLQHIETRSPQENTSKHDNIPVHCVRLHRRRTWEEAKHEERRQKNERDDIDCHPRTA